MIKSIVVPKKTNSYADGMVAIGWADLIAEILKDKQANVVIKDERDHYLIDFNYTLTKEDMEKCCINPGFPYIKTIEPDPEAPQFGKVYDYTAERAKEDAWRKFRQKAGRKQGKIIENHEHTPSEPDPLLPIIKTYNSLRMGSNCLNQLYLGLSDSMALNEIVARRIGITETISEQAENLRKKLASIPSSLQIFSPISGKGIHRSKPDSTALGSIPDKMIDWFDEWMKYRAFLKCMLSYYSGPDGKDTKIMCIAPGDIPVAFIEEVHKELLNKKLYGSLQLDIRLLLEVARVLIEKSKELNGEKGLIAMLNSPPNKIIKGLYSVYFQNLGQASAVMNISFLGLPGWFPVKDRQSAEDWLEIISEHLVCLQTLDESHSDNISLLLIYRSFLSSGELELLLDFWALFGMRFMQLKAQNKWAQAFTLNNVRRLLMSYEIPSLLEIINNIGFQNIAYAIRKSTINPMMQKAITKKAPFEIHYGLAQQWKRKARYKIEFVQELSDFAQKYNLENTKLFTPSDKTDEKEKRKYITDQDLTEVINLIEKHGSELVGMLLLAYGYARDSKNENEKNEEMNLP